MPLTRILLTLFVIATAGAMADAMADDAFFESRIRPVLVKHCYECHSESAEVVQAGLRLDHPEAMRSGGESGAVIVPGKPDASLLIQSLKYVGSEMPPSGPLDDRIVSDFETWVLRGAVDPRPALGVPEPEQVETVDGEQLRQFWAFRRPLEHPTPQVYGAMRVDEWANHWIDRFIQKRLMAAGLKPSPTADRRTLARRLTFDLTGLPPTPDEVNAFESDRRPDALTRLVDQLLASPQQGEHTARMWLDVARYAEDQAHKVGNNDALTYPNAYLYRDWTIQAFATDMPYDDFIRLQLAADHYAPDDKQKHLALGFLGLGPKYYRRNSPEVMADEWEDRIDTVSRGLLGLTVACARCHDHKYDPIPTEDYYALAGVFASTEMFNRPMDETVKTKGDQAADPRDAVHIVRDGKVRDINVMLRGDVGRPGDLVPRRFLSVLSSTEPLAFGRGSGRADLAEAIVDTNNPLTARVIVNRVWRRLMGRGLVETPSNFGTLGESPSHPELLDTLAVRFMQQDWSLKWLQREIVLSATYRQSGQASEAAMEVDPENRLLSHMSRKRLSIEAYRDAVLSAAGRLDHRLGGESISPENPHETRRTIYSEISRMELNALLARFDFPDPNAHSAKRVLTTTPLQKLFLMNSDFMAESAKALAERSQTVDDTMDRIEFLYNELFGRVPTPTERDWAERFVESDQPSRWTPSRWKQYAQILLISNEMLFVD